MWSNPRRRTALLLFMGLSVLYGITSNPSPSLDVVSANFASWHLLQEGVPWVEATGFLENHSLKDVWLTTVGGHVVVSRFPGVIAASMPAYAIAQLDEFSNMPAALTAAVLTAAAVSLMFLALSSRLAVRTSLLFCLAFGMGTPVWSVAADGMWPHTIAVFSIGGMAWAAGGGRWWGVGIFGGIALWGRPHVAVVVAVLGLLEGWRNRDWRIVARIGIPGAVFFLAYLIWMRWMYGRWSLTGGYPMPTADAVDERYSSLLTNELGLFFSLDRGIVAWTPVIVVLLPSLWRARSELPGWSTSLLAGGLSYILLQGYLNHFSGGDTFWGYRLGLELVACALPAFAFAWHRAGPIARSIAGPLVVWQMVVISIGARQNLGGALVKDAWWNNSVVAVFREQPQTGVLIVAAAIILGYAVPRVVLDPAIRGRDRSGQA